MAEVWISAASPLLKYSPSNSNWVQQTDGSVQYHGNEPFAVELNAYFSSISWYYDQLSSQKLQVRIDGSLEEGSAQSGSASLPASFNTHTAKLQSDCKDCGSAGSSLFILQGVKLLTQLVETGTLDDASSQITYTGFQSATAPNSDITAIKTGTFQGDTVSYTSSGGASASFSFQGSAVYIFGMTGPGFGCYEVKVNSQVIGTYNASSSVETYNSLLFFTTYLEAQQNQQVVITNQNDGCLFALDYITYVVSGSSGTNSTGTSASGSSPVATAIFPSQAGSNNNNSTTTGDSGGAVIGGVIGSLAGLFLLWVLWRLRQWKKGGGQGSFMVALCGGFKTKTGEEKEENKFHLWPMVWARPKYDT
ncbi:uncharacterized protein I206_100953 [Kwoniella pini CBS 10737]|uniref:Uncharacterized protein n=1 Tax=Kwoniella pini CBS 10737 TaxID=1296096 RepID=A0AAJ8L0A6_9TREE